MSDDFRVTRRSNAETRQPAKRLREFFGAAEARHIDVLECARRPKIWTINGERPLTLEVRADVEMPDADGITVEHDGIVTIRLTQSVHYQAYMGVGRARTTIAHELGHATLGHAAHVRGAQLARRPQTNITPVWLPPYESAEHQAKVFAPAFLIKSDLRAPRASRGWLRKCARCYCLRNQSLHTSKSLAPLAGATC